MQPTSTPGDAIPNSWETPRKKWRSPGKTSKQCSTEEQEKGWSEEGLRRSLTIQGDFCARSWPSSSLNCLNLYAAIQSFKLGCWLFSTLIGRKFSGDGTKIIHFFRLPFEELHAEGTKSVLKAEKAKSGPAVSNTPGEIQPLPPARKYRKGCGTSVRASNLSPLPATATPGREESSMDSTTASGSVLDRKPLFPFAQTSRFAPTRRDKTTSSTNLYTMVKFSVFLLNLIRLTQSLEYNWGQRWEA